MARRFPSSSVCNSRGQDVISFHVANITSWGSADAIRAGTTKSDRIFALPDPTFDIMSVFEARLTPEGVSSVTGRLRRNGWHDIMALADVSDEGTVSGGVGLTYIRSINIQALLDPLPGPN